MAVDPTTPDPETLDALRLQMTTGLSPRMLKLLLDRFESPGNVLRASREELVQFPDLKPRVVQALAAARENAAAPKEWQACRDRQIQMLIRNRRGYPHRLTEIPDPPLVLYSRGDFATRDDLAIGIVGSRRCTLYGQQQAERLAGALARAGFTIVSGLARGIDAAAHRGALLAGGRTIAVLATAVNDIYPPEHDNLAEEVACHGAVVSEAPLGRRPRPEFFPQRNRIISGLSLGVIVVEADRRSGALSTARHAMEQNREIFAVPGRIDNSTSDGCHDLIRDGATLIRGVDDVLQTLGPLPQPVLVSETSETVHDPRELALNSVERKVLNSVTRDPLHIDEIVRLADLETPQVLQTITILEIKRLVKRLPGGHLCRG